MVERYQGEQLPPVHPDPYGRPPTPDGDRVPVPPAPLPAVALRRARILAAVTAVVVLAAIVLGKLQ